MGKQVQVQKGKNNRSCLWIILGAIFLICFAPILCVGVITAALFSGLISDVDLQTANFSEAMNDAETARVEIFSGVAQINISTLDDSNNLFEGDITYFGEIDFTAGGGADRVIRLEQLSVDENVFGLFDVFNIVTNSDEVTWNVGLAPDVPTEINIESGIENSTLDLSTLNLTGLTTNFGVGDIDLTLPTPQQSYRVTINAGIGNVAISLPETGAIRLEADQGIGDLDTGRLLEVTSDESTTGNTGVWETEGFENAEITIIIDINGGVGDITLR